MTAVTPGQDTAPRVKDELKSVLERDLEAKARTRATLKNADGAEMFSDGSVPGADGAEMFGDSSPPSQ